MWSSASGVAVQQRSERQSEELQSLQEELGAKLQDGQRLEEPFQQAEAKQMATETEVLQAKEVASKMEEEFGLQKHLSQDLKSR